MEYPHTITIFGEQNKDGTYPKKTIEGVFWYGTENINISGKGIVTNDSINIIIPREKIPTDFKIKRKNRIVKGIAEIKESITELENYDEVITVTSVNNYDCGSELDCLLIGGK